MRMLGTLPWVVLGVVLSGPAPAETCASMNRELSRLRAEYRSHARHTRDEPRDVAFQRLTAILDKIVALKHEMRKANCEVPPRQPAPRDKR
jgi:hypothetical protein